MAKNSVFFGKNATFLLPIQFLYYIYSVNLCGGRFKPIKTGFFEDAVNKTFCLNNGQVFRFNPLLHTANPCVFYVNN